MKRIAVYLTISHIAFSCGVGVASLWRLYTAGPTNGPVALARQSRPNEALPPATGVSAPVTASSEIVFGKGRLRIITHQVRMESESLRYKIDVSYPEIVGSNDPHIQDLNRHIKKLVTGEYQWLMKSSKADLRFYKEKHPEAFNEVNLDYEVRLATDRLLSIYFIGYSYGIGAAHSVQYSFTVNYDLASRKELNLSDMFKPKSKYLEFIAQYCREDLSKQPDGGFMFSEALSPKAKNFESWNITANGLIFNFDACKLAGCAAGKQAVEIPFTAVNQFISLNAGNSK